MSKPRTGFLATCPCCGEKVKVDARLRRLDPMDPSKKKPSKLLDDASDVLENPSSLVRGHRGEASDIALLHDVVATSPQARLG